MVAIGNFFFHYRNIILPLFFLTILIPSPELFANPTSALLIGFSVSLIGQVIRMGTIGLVYIIRGGQNRNIYAQDLVTTGIFAHCRNPLYIGNILVSVGMGIASNSVLFFSLITPFIIFVYQAIVLAEENFLRGKFGSGYDAYAKAVNRWFPNLSGIGETFRNHTFNWKRVILKEYNSTATGIALGILLVAKAYYQHPEIYGDFSESKWNLVIIFLSVMVVYLFVKFLKKTKRLKE